MKLDDKKKKVQMKYREKIRGNKEDGNYSKKMLVVVTTILLGQLLLKPYVIQFKIL
ncbi:hypothetical protein [Peribacillus simplex]|uniref:hypothetical protein n=1 Tax=Peribacillus simplex TaxID=1478 RepID=UPI003D085ABB